MSHDHTFTCLLQCSFKIKKKPMVKPLVHRLGRMFTKQMRGLALRYMTLMDVMAPDDFYAMFVGSVLILQSKRSFKNRLAPDVYANCVMINLSILNPTADYISRGGCTMIKQLCYGKPRQSSTAVKHLVARKLKLEHYYDCKLQALNETLFRLYFGTCIFRDTWYLYFDVIYNTESEMLHFITFKKLEEAVSMGLCELQTEIFKRKECNLYI